MKNYVQRSAEQMKCPSGLSGLVAARIMKRYNAVAETWTVQQLHLSPDDHILEIGFGPGCGLQEALSRIDKGVVEGIDTSSQMMKMASHRNRAAIASGKLRLFEGDAAKLPFEDRSFDKIFAVNVFYFWKDPDKPLGEILRVLRDGGQFALYLVEKNDLLKLKQAHTSIFHVPEDSEVVQYLHKNGFKDCVVTKHDEGMRTGVCIIAHR
jgi:SAM-dependent methyltransferase